MYRVASLPLFNERSIVIVVFLDTLRTSILRLFIFSSAAGVGEMQLKLI